MIQLKLSNAYEDSPFYYRKLSSGQENGQYCMDYLRLRLMLMV